MKFEMNNYYRNISDAELIEDIKNIAKLLGKNTLIIDEYNTYGKYNSSTLIRRFGSWKNVLISSGLELKGHNFKISFTDDEVITNLEEVANFLGKETFSRKEYASYGKYSYSILIKRYGSWNEVLKLAGMKPNINRNFTNEEMFEEIERIWCILGRHPTSSDIKNGISKFSLQSYSRRFGGWRGALQSFIEYINCEDTNTSNELSMYENDKHQSNEQILTSKSISIPHKTNRNINLRLRFKVLQRDNFKCCACGASPAKDPTVELHIDHIIPWSKGGETEIDNLQTLCSKCNLGKSDVF